MIRFSQRGVPRGEPIGKHPLWLSNLLRSRGVDTEEKAESFLHPSLSQLHDPMLMQGMDKALTLIREATERGDRIQVYGDYDCDGVCAASIMWETLTEYAIRQGKEPQVDWRIPTRHGEGYGLNMDAIREIAVAHKLLITVDCGVTNHDEVRLAQTLGMRVIVTDHHQLAKTPSPADVVLNPLLGEYPFRRLCGAGVALKVCQALLGMDALKKRIDLAALATVADLVMLTDENRAIVSEGLRAIANTDRPGLRALMILAGLGSEVTSTDLAFRLAPRINAGGRMEEAAQCVRLLTGCDRMEAEEIARHLEDNNQARRAEQDRITAEAEKMMRDCVNFRTDQVIIIMGSGWNSGIIGLAAGRLCEKYHFPVIVLSESDGVAVGSCRSIPGVDIHGMLTKCSDLFIRFGGHEQAAGLTMLAELVPELRRRLNLYISESCDPQCYIPVSAYDQELPLDMVTVDTIRRLNAMEPTGFGNPRPVFLVRNAYLQEARAVGKDGNTLKLSLLDGNTVRSGVAFRMGNLAGVGMTGVDVLYEPSLNEFRGVVNPQIIVSAIRSAESDSSLPDSQRLFRALVQEICYIAENNTKVPDYGKLPELRNADLRKMLEGGRGVLLIGHEAGRAAAIAGEFRVDIALGRIQTIRNDNTLLCDPEIQLLTDLWQTIILLDGELLPGEAELIREKCPSAELYTMKANPDLQILLQRLKLSRDQLIGVYRALTAGTTSALLPLAEMAEMSSEQTLVALYALRQAKLIEFREEPWSIRLLPFRHLSPEERNPINTPLMRYIGGMLRH